LTEYIVISVAAFIGSGLTFFSGFGLGTILVPVFAAFFPIEVAIILTAIVHFLNNLFKLVLIGEQAKRSIVFRFGLPAIVFALIGAWVLTQISGLEPIQTYSLFGATFHITMVKLIIGVLLLLFALVEIIPSLSTWNFDPKYIPLGGVLSGFFGGLSGNQGALRSAFLMRAGLTKEQFIATGVVIAVLIDTARMTVYFYQERFDSMNIDYPLLVSATLSAFAGAVIGNQLLKKLTVKTLHTMIAVMLLAFSVCLAGGIV
jgi:uncharacterized protein